jgi:aspartyl-tRNA(Asn)/glutamyl-tRNA(Gln) amidotransferase subunit C
MHLSTTDVQKIATYSRIGLTEAEVQSMTVDLNNIIDSLEPITQYDLEGVEPTFHPIAGLSNVMREDLVVQGLTHDQALANAPAQQDGQFKIPPILGGESA